MNAEEFLKGYPWVNLHEEDTDIYRRHYINHYNLCKLTHQIDNKVYLNQFLRDVFYRPLIPKAKPTCSICGRNTWSYTSNVRICRHCNSSFTIDPFVL